MPDHDRFGSLSGGAYRKPGTVTGSNPDNFTETDPAPYLGGTGVNNNKLTDAYNPTDADGTDLVQTSFNAETDHVDPAPHAPNFWRFGRDPYKHLGMPGEAYLDNSAGPTNSDLEAASADGGPAVL